MSLLRLGCSILATCALTTLSACSEDDPAARDNDSVELDGGRGDRVGDAGRAQLDARVATGVDAGRSGDAGRAVDGGSSAAADAADADDAGPTGDAARPLDAGRAPDAGSPAVPDGGRPGFPAGADIAAMGPFATQNPQGDLEGPECVIHRPAKLGEGGLRHPLIVWGMGTGGFNTYGPSFELWASHGFVVTASLLGNGQGDGKTMLACLAYACEKYADQVDCRAGASGHSQGGGGALMAGRDPRVVATAPIQAYTSQGFGGFDQASFSQQSGPMLLLSGTADTIAVPSANQEPVYQKTNAPVVWANLIGGDHVVTGIDGALSYRSVVLAWFRLHLMGDEDFRGMFYGPACTLCQDPAWMVQRRNIP